MYPIGITLRHIDKKDRILEAGFGGGRVIRHLARHGFDVEGIERDSGIVDALMKVDPGLKISRGDILDLNFPDDHFDGALCFGVVGNQQHDIKKAVAELRRVTKKDGTIILSVALDNLARLCQRLMLNFKRGENREFYAWVDTKKGWEGYFKSLGFRIIGSEPVVLRYNLYYWVHFLRAKKKPDLRLTRVRDEEFKFNWLGEALWRLHRSWLKNQLASGITFVLKNDKTG